MPRLSIIIPVHNNWNFTKACLEDLVKLPEDHEIIVVDNGSTDDTADGLLGFAPRVTVLALEENAGFAFACNTGYKKSAGSNVVFLNNDIRVRKDHEIWTSPLIKAAEAGVLAGPTGGILDKNLNFVTETSKMAPGNFYISGWCLAGSKSILDRLILKDHLGPFSTEFGLAYFEDTDLSFRAKELEIPLQIISVPVFHFGKMTSSKLNTLGLYLPAKEKFIKKWK